MVTTASSGRPHRHRGTLLPAERSIYACCKRGDRPWLQCSRLTETSFRFREKLRTTHCARPATFVTRIVHCSRKSSQVEREVSLKGFKPMATLSSPAEPAQSSSLELLEPLLNIQQAAKLLGISPCTLRNWVQRKRIARVKVGGRVMFRPDTMRKFIVRNTYPGSD